MDPFAGGNSSGAGLVDQRSVVERELSAVIADGQAALEAERVAQPLDGLGDIGIGELRDDACVRDRAVLRHAANAIVCGVGLLAWLDRLAGRFNRTFESTAIAASVEQGGAKHAVDPLAVSAALGALEKRQRDEEAGNEPG
jgi:hypothetical protein